MGVCVENCLILCVVHLQTYVPTVFENYTAGLELEEQRVELSLWDTSGKGPKEGSFIIPEGMMNEPSGMM